MRRPHPLPLFVILALLAPGAGAFASDSQPRPVPALVVSVVDGDTLDVRVRIWLDQEIRTRVRLDGIDTPESRSRCAAEKDMARRARARLEGLVDTAAGTVMLHDVDHDKYGGRVRARVSLPDGTDLAEALVAGGHARRYAGGTRQPWCPTTPPQVGEAPGR